MNASFYALFATLFVMLILTSGNGHVWALLGLSLGLFLSIKWYASRCTANASAHLLTCCSRFLVQISDVEESRRLERLAKEADELKGAKEVKTE